MLRNFAFWMLAAMFFAASPAYAALSFTLTTGNNSTSLQKVVIDSNQCPTNGPSAAFTGGIVRNTGATTATNITVSLSGLANGFALGGGQAASQSLGSLAAGQSIAVYWQVGYGCIDGTTTTPTVTMASSAGTQTRSYTLRTQQSKSANAGGQVTSSTLGPGAVVGQVITLDVTYDFGGTANGDEYFVQPSGSTAFNAGCFRLVGNAVVSSNLSAFVPGTQNYLYFVQPSAQPGNNYFATIRYSFQYLCAGSSTVARPYAAQTSGTQLKYTGNFDGTGSVQITYPGATNPFTITKTANVSGVTLNGARTVIYTVTINNPSAHNSIVSSITDLLPTGATFGAIQSGSDVTVANSNSTPATGASGTLTFSGNANQSYQIAAGGSVKLIYSAVLPATVGTYVNSARGVFGLATTATASASVQVFDPALNVTKVSAVHSDPLNGTSNPKAIPTGTVEYTILVSNPNPIALDSESVVVTDGFPSNLELLVSDVFGVGSGPMSYSDTDTGLSYSYLGLSNLTDDLAFSNDNGATWSYVPVADANGADPAVTHVRIQPSGSMSALADFTLKLRFRIK